MSKHVPFIQPDLYFPYCPHQFSNVLLLCLIMIVLQVCIGTASYAFSLLRGEWPSGSHSLRQVTEVSSVE